MTQEKHFEDWKEQYDVFCNDKGVLRFRGRLGNSEFQYGTQNPIILSKQYHLALLIIRQAHEKVFHNGVKDTLTEVRAKYWIVRGLVRSVVLNCVLCKRFEVIPFSSITAIARVKEAPPFPVLR